jgi:hypothetical protein
MKRPPKLAAPPKTEFVPRTAAYIHAHQFGYRVYYEPTDDTIRLQPQDIQLCTRDESGAWQADVEDGAEVTAPMVAAVLAAAPPPYDERERDNELGRFLSHGLFDE